MLAESRIIANAGRRTRQLAETMRRVGPDNCTRATLLAEGFSGHELDVLGTAARQLADRRFVRRAAEDRRDAPLMSDDELIAIAGDRCAGLIRPEAILIRLRECGFTHETIDRLWDRLMPKLASRLAAELIHLPRPARSEA